MFSIRQLQNKFKNHENKIIIILSIALALYLRRGMIYFESNDFIYYLKPWYDFIRQHNGLYAFKYEFSNYNPPYLYWLVIINYLFSSLPLVVMIKLFSIASDFIGAFFVYKIVKLKYPFGKLPAIAFITVLFTPTVFVNSAYWGQADMVYTSALLACIYFLISNKDIWAFISFAVALSFKLQTIFLAPLLIILLIKRNVKLKSFLLIPPVFLITLLPACIGGASLIKLLFTYVGQAQYYKYLTMGLPNLYQWVPNKFYHLAVPMGFLLTFSLLCFFWIYIYRTKTKLSTDMIVKIALISVLLMPYFLPKMHERYFFPADVISIIYGFYFPKYFFVPITIIMSSLFSYLPFVGNSGIVSPKALSIVIFIILSILVYDFYKTFQVQQSKE
jgi:Gpi18-like mannosyltransferase